MTKLPQLILKNGREKSVLKHHLWIFSGSVKGVSQNLHDGDVVEVFSNNGEYLATGHFEDGSICVRILSFVRTNIDNDFWRKQIENAINKRKAMQLFDFNCTNAFRIIHAESDMMPGLIADYYNGAIVLQAHSVGMFNALPVIAECFVELLGSLVHTIYCKSATTVRRISAERDKNFFLYGSQTTADVCENGMKYTVDFVNGQKTGFFIDQRNNRQIVSDYCKGKRVLNVFGYTGAFSVAALKGGAKHVTTVDVSASAIEMTKHNIKANFGDSDNHTEIVADVFDFFNTNKELYDLIVLDPPAFAKHLSSKDNAMKAYRRLNAIGMKQLNNNGLLFTFSCSQVILKNDFLTIVYNAGCDAKKNVSIIQQLHQSADHCINIYHPETEYLKGMALIIN